MKLSDALRIFGLVKETNPVRDRVNGGLIFYDFSSSLSNFPAIHHRDRRVSQKVGPQTQKGPQPLLVKGRRNSLGRRRRRKKIANHFFFYYLCVVCSNKRNPSVNRPVFFFFTFSFNIRSSINLKNGGGKIFLECPRPFESIDKNGKEKLTTE